MAWLWGIIIGFLTWYNMLHILLALFVKRAIKEFKSDRASKVQSEQNFNLAICGIVYIATLICFFTIPYLLSFQSWTIPMAFVGSGIAFIFYLFTDKKKILKAVEEKDQLLEKELEDETKGMTAEEEEKLKEITASLNDQFIVGGQLHSIHEKDAFKLIQAQQISTRISCGEQYFHCPNCNSILLEGTTKCYNCNKILKQ